MKKLTLLSSILAGVTAFGCIGLMGCKKTEPSNSVEYDHSAFLGVSETAVGGKTDGWVLENTKALGAQAFRVEIDFNELFKAKKEDTLSFNEVQLEKYQTLIAGLKASGVKKIALVNTSYIQPYGYGCTSKNAIPDPVTENADYVRFLQLQEKAFVMLAREFPEAEYFQPAYLANDDSYLHKNGYLLTADEETSAAFYLSEDEQYHVIADMCWYVNRGISQQNAKLRVVLPSVANGKAESFLEGVYRAIAAHTLPIAQEFADDDPDNYFQVLSWQPTLSDSVGIDKAQIGDEKQIYAIAQSNGDGDKPVWYTQIGWNDIGTQAAQQTIAENYLAFFNAVKTELPFVETAYLARLAAPEKREDGVQDFGIVYGLTDLQYPATPKPAALAIAKYIRGEDADLSGFYRYLEN